MRASTSTGGVDYRGVARALVADLTGGVRQGASTITMQVARNFFLSPEKTVKRKLTEVVLAYRIESALEQGPDPRAVHEPDLPRPAHVRLYQRRPHLFQEAPARN
jgi:hypothetical protein